MSRLRKRPKSILRLKVNGPHIRPGRIPIPELLVICEQAQTAVNRQAEVLRGKRGLRPGPTATVVKDECTLELFSIGRGSAVISFAGPEAKPQAQGDLDLDIQKLGEAAVREVVLALRAARTKKTPVAMDVGVKRTFQEMGRLLDNGVSKIEWSAPGIRGKRSRVTAVFDNDVRARIEETARDSSSKRIEIDGRLEWRTSSSAAECIIHAPDGQRVTCSLPLTSGDVCQGLRHHESPEQRQSIRRQSGEHIALSSVKCSIRSSAAARIFLARTSAAHSARRYPHDLRTLKCVTRRRMKNSWLLSAGQSLTGI